MFPSSPPTNSQQHHHHTQFPSIVRTRSQQGRPLAPIDFYASPLKKAIRNHNHSMRQTRSELKTENVMVEHIAENNTHDETSFSPSHKKRASSPSFARNDNAGKRTRVLVQSSKINSLSRGHSEESLGTPHRDNPATPVKPSPAKSYGSPGKGLTHMDLTRVPSSPSKPSGSPNKTFKITKDDGYTMRVPITPVRRLTQQDNEMRTAGLRDRPSAMEEQVRILPLPPLIGPAAILVQPSTPVLNPTSPTSTNYITSRVVEEGAKCQHIHPNDTTQTQFQSTAVRSPGKDLLFVEGSLLTPLPTPHPNSSTLSLKPNIPFSISGQGITSAARSAIPSTSSELLQNSPSKSRIPVPSSSSLSRLPRLPSSLSISTLPVAGSSSPIKAPLRSSLVKTKIRTKGKSGIRSRAPLTRLAAKRGLRRTSSSTELRTGASSVGSNAPPSPSVSAELSNAAVAGSIRSSAERRSLVTSSLLSSENAPAQVGGSARLPASSSSGSPKKPTPLTALSTALQKLMATPPAAPFPRPCPNTSLGLTHDGLIPSQAPTPTPPLSKSQDDVDLGIQTPASSQNSVVLQKSKTLGHTQLNKMNTGVGKIGLPLRRPSTADSNGRVPPWAGAPFASKQTTLSTVPASPSRSAVPTEGEMARDAIAEVLDVDAWISSGYNDRRKEDNEKETDKPEYLVPLADEPRTKEHEPLELVSPSRRASQASILLSQSLSLPRGPTVRHQARSASASTAVQPIPRTPVKTRGRTRPPLPAPQSDSDRGATAKPDDPMGGKRSNARMPGSLDVLKDCIIFVDVRTEEGEDAGALFVDMLRGLGARILAKPGKSCTHLVYKAGLPSTITRYKLLPEPRPLPVSIGWVVECVEKRAHVDEMRFLVNLNEIGVAGGVQRRRSMQPRHMRTLTLGQLDNGEPADISVRADSSFTSEEPSTSGLILANVSPSARSPHNNLPPLERARQRSFRLPRE